MGAAESKIQQPKDAGEENASNQLDQFVLIMTAPPGVGKEQLMGTFIAENVRSVAYVAKVGAVRANEPV
jgi:ATP-dependent Lon protease